MKVIDRDTFLVDKTMNNHFSMNKDFYRLAVECLSNMAINTRVPPKKEHHDIGLRHQSPLLGNDNCAVTSFILTPYDLPAANFRQFRRWKNGKLNYT